VGSIPPAGTKSREFRDEQFPSLEQFEINSGERFRA
jgi:hypothetical protein